MAYKRIIEVTMDTLLFARLSEVRLFARARGSSLNGLLEINITKLRYFLPLFQSANETVGLLLPFSRSPPGLAASAPSDD